MIIIPDKLRRPAEVEREELRKQLAEARAEIDRLKSLVVECSDWNWLDENSYDSIPKEITNSVDALRKECLENKRCF